MNDGSLHFSTKVDTSGFENGTSSLEQAMEKLTRSIRQLTDSIVKSFEGTAQAVEKTGAGAEKAAEQVDEIAEAAKRAEKEAEALQKQMDSIEVAFYDASPGPEIDYPEQIIEVNPANIGYNKEAMDFIEGYGGKAKQAEKYTNEFKMEIESLSKKLKELESQGMYFGDDEYDSAYMKLAKVKQALSDYKKEMLSPTPDAEIPVKFDMDSFEGQKQLLKQQIAELEKQGITLGNPDYDSVYTALQRIIQAEGEYKRALLSTDAGQKKVAKSAVKMNSRMKATEKAAVPLSKSILKLSNMFKLMLIRMAMRAVIDSIKEGFQNLAQYSSGVNGTLSSLMSSLLYLKNSFSTAFAPVLDFIVPALNAMINAIASALAWIGQLAAALSGSGSFVKAKKTQEDYAASLKKTGAAAKQAGKDARKSLAPFDELNVLADKNSDGGGGGASGTDPSQMFETVEIDSRITSLADQMKDAFSSFLSWAQENFGPSFQKVWEDMLPNIEVFQSILSGIWGDLGSLAGPLEEWFNTDFVALLQQFIETGGEILNGLFESFNMVFSDIWNLVVFPILSNFITSGLPMLTQFATQALDAFGVLFGVVKDIFDRIWKDAAAPALELLTGIWTDCVDSLAKAWDEYGEPIFEAIKKALEGTGEVITDAWDKYIKPVFDTFMDAADRLWKNHLKPLLDHFLEFGAKLILVALDIYNEMILPLVKWFNDLFGPTIDFAIQGAINIFGTLAAFLTGITDTILLVLNGLLDFLHMGFTEGWDKAWENVGDIFKGVFNGIVQIAENAINYIVDSLNGMSFDVPDWIPVIGGKKFGFELSQVRLPRLASGTVVPPRAGEFAAILGDNNREAEVVSPVSTIEQALRNVMEEFGGLGGGDITIKAYLDGEKVYENMVRRNAKTTSTTGQNPLVV